MSYLFEGFGRALKRIREYVYKNKRNHYNVPLLKRIKYAILGFCTDEAIYNNIDVNNYKEFLTYYEKTKTGRINGEFGSVLGNKLIFEEVAGKYTRVPVNYACISDGNVYGLKDYDINNNNVIQFLKSIKICTLKLQNDCGGKGFHLIKYIAEDEFDVNGKIISSEELLKIIINCKDDGLLTEYMYQSEFSASLYPHSANTIRIVCARKKNERDFHIIAAAQRLGSDSSKPVDNVGTGGLSCSINIETGELGYARQLIACDIEHCHKKYDTHPDTGAQLKGRVIPNWEKLKKDILALTYKFPYLKLIGWDVLLTNDGFCIIEANNTSDLDLIQVEKGLRYEALGDVYRSYGINGVNDIKIKR